MRTINFAKRNFKEIIRDPLSVVFALALPLFLLYIFQQFKLPDEIYNIKNFTPGIIVFSFSFISLFTATLVATDRSTSLLTRLCASPMKIKDYIIGYIISILPLVVIQNILFFITAILLGLPFSFNIVLAILVSIPVSILFIGLGLLIGCVASERSSSGIGSVVVQLVAFTSGMYFDTSMVGKTFGIICKILPFGSCLNIIRGILSGNYVDMEKSIGIVLVYTVVVIILSITLFKRKLESDNK